MKDWRNLLVSKDLSLLEAIKVIDKTRYKFVLVINQDGKLLGTLSDGDIRRGLIRGDSLDAPIEKSMNPRPFSFSGKESKKEMIRLLREKVIQFAPVVDEQNVIRDVCLLDNLILPQKRENPIVLMAGGPGTRLGSLTMDTPKPMLKLGEKPILQLIIECFRDQGFSNIFVSVNYLASVIEDYFKDGRQFGVNIRYLREEKRLGTAGSLSLLPETGNLPLFVMNADIFTQVNYQDMLEYYELCGLDALMCVRQHDVQVPFGVVRTNGNLIEGIDEKPVHSFFVNAGIYLLNRNAVKLVPSNAYYDMTLLFEDVRAQNFKSGIFPIDGVWKDLGTKAELDKMRSLFQGERISSMIE